MIRYTVSMKNWGLTLLAAVMMTFVSCSKTFNVPQNASPNGKQVSLFPDYTDVTIPPNIAPLNFMIKSEGNEYVVEIKVNGKTQLVCGGEEDGIVEFDSIEWRKALNENKGKSLQVTVYVNNNGKWTYYKPYNLYVAHEDIDPYLSYRLIEPGFEMYRQVGLYQRNLTNFTQKPIYENNRHNDQKENHCVNCHNYQNYGGHTMLFHVRANMGGTLIAKDGKIEKINFKCDSILGNAVYPSWHPKKNYVVFSSNQTGQAFHTLDAEKIEVLDYGSDLIFYNADTHEVSNILKTDGAMETFPCWAPDGKKIYFCQADMPVMAALSDSLKINFVLSNYRSIKYNIMSVTFDENTMSFGEPQMEVNCEEMGKSATVPRVSPDGKYLLFTLGDFGQFHIWHKSSDQYVKNLLTGEVYPLKEANSSDVDSYHSWSSNGRWIVFSSRRDDGSFSRPYITYFDKTGRAHKAFMLPQEDPMSNVMLLKSYNVPEFTCEPVSYSSQEFKTAIYEQIPGTSVKYKELRTPEAIAHQYARNQRDRNTQITKMPLSNSAKFDSVHNSQGTENAIPSSKDVSSPLRNPDAQSGASPKQ